MCHGCQPSPPLLGEKQTSPPEISTATSSVCLQDWCDPGATTFVVTSHLHPPQYRGGCGALSSGGWQELLMAGSSLAPGLWCLNNMDAEGTSPHWALSITAAVITLGKRTRFPSDYPLGFSTAVKSFANNATKQKQFKTAHPLSGDSACSWVKWSSVLTYILDLFSLWPRAGFQRSLWALISQFVKQSWQYFWQTMLNIWVTVTALRYSDGRGRKDVIFIRLQFHCKNLIKQAPGNFDWEYLLSKCYLTEQFCCLLVLTPMNVY